MGRALRGWLFSAARHTWHALRERWLEFLVTEIAAAFAVMFLREGREVREAFEALAIAAGVILAAVFLRYLLVAPPIARVRRELAKRRAYRALWSVPDTWDAAIRAEPATRQEVGGHLIDYDLCTRMALLGAVVSTDEIADEICRIYRITEPKRRAIVASAVVGTHNLMWTHGLVVGSGGGTLETAARVLEFSRIRQVAELRRQYGPPSCWT